MSKYHSRKITADGMTFDSAKEYRRWKDLQLLERAGEISGLQRQAKYVLIPPQREPDRVGPKGGRKPGRLLERECAYYADFVYIKGGHEVVEDVKGVKTPEYKIKKKLMLWVHGIRIHET